MPYFPTPCVQGEAQPAETIRQRLTHEDHPNLRQLADATSFAQSSCDFASPLASLMSK
jgi:hypothetical protein